jgi:hypothetical protein
MTSNNVNLRHFTPILEFELFERDLLKNNWFLASLFLESTET